MCTAAPAMAVPQSKLDQARTVKAQIDRLDNRVEYAAERYNVASSRHAALAVKQRRAAARFTKVKKRQQVVQRHLRVRATSMYRQGPMGFLDVLLGAQSFEEFSATWDLLKDLNTDDAEAVAELKTLRAEAKKARADLTRQERAAARQVAIMRANRRSIESQLAERKAKLSGLEAEIARLDAAEEAARRARAASFVSNSGGANFDSFPAPTRAPRSEVVDVAKRYLGAPYVWGAAGPNSFDCSGLMMFVYRQVGVSLPHSSRAQIGSGERVSRGDLQPGDLVFFGSPIHHVGMYVGGGMYIHAPHSGDVVKISALDRGDYAGACRP
ncbi:MAG: hypothetical protein FDZ75_01585 [Actinobacteria bacterium]|nr:MAG: hypothetical protein FDZ75_01585 [Actinomycetota bacterium]